MIGRNLLQQVQELLAPIRVQLANVVARAVINTVADGATLQALQIGVQAGHELDDVERFQQYGFSSVPLPGAEGVVVCPMGDTGIPLVIATDDRRYRPTGLEGGQWALYDKDGIRILRGPSGEIVITAKAGQKVFLSDGTGGTDPLVPHSAYAIHTHPTGTGPSGPPDNAATAKTANVEAQ